ncbi:MAG: hypothetical protein HQK54_06355 [Oligoflexales bacterium]|nr:hypothetical protein [Oligoflexales bacterium]
MMRTEPVNNSRQPQASSGQGKEPDGRDIDLFEKKLSEAGEGKKETGERSGKTGDRDFGGKKEGGLIDGRALASFLAKTQLFGFGEGSSGIESSSLQPVQKSLNDLVEMIATHLQVIKNETGGAEEIRFVFNDKLMQSEVRFFKSGEVLHIEFQAGSIASFEMLQGNVQVLKDRLSERVKGTRCMVRVGRKDDTDLDSIGHEGINPPGFQPNNDL